MAFNIANFKNQVGEFLRPFAYDVIVTPPTGDARQLTLRTESITLPGVSFAEADAYKIYGNGLTLSIPHTSTVQEITCVHTIDVEGEVLQTFFDWANQIVDLDGSNKFSAYYYRDYLEDMTINVYDVRGQSPKPIKKYKLVNAYPAAYDQVQMSWESGGEIARLSVTYKFEHFKLES